MKSLTLIPATPISTLVLIGGGEFSFGETREIDSYLVSKMAAGKRTIAFLPTASGSAEYATHLGRYFRELEPTVDVVNVPVYRGRDNRRQKNLDALSSAGMIYVGGGVTNNLLDTLRGSPAEAAMREAAAGGAIIAAIGAAASCFGVHARDMRSAGGALPGLGWLDGAVIETSFTSQDDVALRRLMSLPDVTIGVGIPAATAVAVSPDGTTSLLGDDPVAVFRKK